MVNKHGYVFAVRFDKPKYWPTDSYLSIRSRIFQAVDRILEGTQIGEKCSIREWNKNIDVVTGSTKAGNSVMRYNYVRWGSEIFVVSDDPNLVGQIRYAFRGAEVITPKRLSDGNVKLGESASAMLQRLLGPQTGARQLELGLYD